MLHLSLSNIPYPSTYVGLGPYIRGGGLSASAAPAVRSIKAAWGRTAQRVACPLMRCCRAYWRMWLS